MSGHVTIEKTKKRYKLQQVLAFLLFCTGVALFVAGAEPNAKAGQVSGVSMAGLYAGLAAFVWYAIVRAFAWWNHG